MKRYSAVSFRAGMITGVGIIATATGGGAIIESISNGEKVDPWSAVTAALGVGMLIHGTRVGSVLEVAEAKEKA